MKRVVIKYPVAKAGEIADIIGNNGFINLLSYSISGAFFDNYVVQHLAVPNEKEDTCIAKFKDYIQKN